MKKEVKLDEMKDVANEWFNSLNPKEDRATIIGLEGNLGAGKTTFVQQVAEILGIKEKVNSPTFVIQKRYDLDNQKFKKLIHIDVYRLESAKELEVLDWDEISKDKENLILIEWPGQGGSLLENIPIIKFKHLDEETREIEFND